jgi:hypothetical protein
MLTRRYVHYVHTKVDRPFISTSSEVILLKMQKTFCSMARLCGERMELEELPFCHMLLKIRVILRAVSHWFTGDEGVQEGTESAVKHGILALIYWVSVGQEVGFGYYVIKRPDPLKPLTGWPLDWGRLQGGNRGLDLG